MISYEEIENFLNQNSCFDLLKIELREIQNTVDISCQFIIDTDNIEDQKTIEIKDMTGWEVLTPNGWSDFKQVKKINKGEFCRLIFHDGTELRCSLYHKIKKHSGEYEYAFKLKEGDKMTGGIITHIEYIKENVELFDLLGVEKNQQYLVDGKVVHNCVGGDTKITLKNTETGEKITVTMKEAIENYKKFN